VFLSSTYVKVSAKGVTIPKMAELSSIYRAPKKLAVMLFWGGYHQKSPVATRETLPEKGHCLPTVTDNLSELALGRAYFLVLLSHHH
jgi:hypothetical protein